MALKNQTSLNPAIWIDSMRESFRNKYIILGNTDADSNYNENTPNAYNDGVRDGVVAYNLKNSDFKEIIRTPTQALWKMGINGTKPGCYNSDGSFYNVDTSPSSWPLYVEVNRNGTGYLYLITRNKKNGRIDSDVITARNSLSNTSGEYFETEDGIGAICIMKMPDYAFANSNRKHIEIERAKTAYDNLTYADYANEQTRAIGICGVGNESRYGTCCLYYESATYDTISGEKYEAGDFYKCLELECYECTKIADSLNKKYRFNHWLGDTAGAGERCLGAGGQLSTTNCGPCSCSIDWDPTRSFYEEIINNKNISDNRSIKQNARFAAKSRELGGSISDVQMDLGGLSSDQLLFSDDYQNVDMNFPLTGDPETPAVIKFDTITNSKGKKYLLGCSIEVHGKGYTTAVPDWNTLKQYLPNLDIGEMKKRIYVHLMPIEGPHLGIEKIFNISTMLDVNLSTDLIRNATDVINFNYFAIADGGGKNKGEGIFEGSGADEEIALRLTEKLVITAPSSSSAPSSGGKGGISPSSNVFEESLNVSSKSDIVQYSKLQAESTTVADVEVSTTIPSRYDVGEELISDDTTWTVTSKTSPVTKAGNSIDRKEINIVHKVPTKITTALPENVSGGVQSRNIRLQLYLGSQKTY